MGGRRLRGMFAQGSEIAGDSTRGADYWSCGVISWHMVTIRRGRRCHRYNCNTPNNAFLFAWVFEQPVLLGI